MLRLAAAALVVLGVALGVAGCDGGEDARPDTFTLSLTGDVQQTVTGAHGYTRLSRYSGIGTGNSYGIALRSAPVGPGSSPFYEWPAAPDSVVSVLLFFSGAEAPRGAFSVAGQPFASASFWMGGLMHIANAGTVTIEPGFGRLTGTFRLTDVYRLTEGPVELVVEGSFDIARDEL